MNQNQIPLLNKIRITERQASAILVLYSFIIFFIQRHHNTNDLAMYMGYFDGWLQGRYTYWFDIKEYVPDTFRNPGFPFFIALLSLVSKKWFFYQFMLWILHSLAIVWTVRIITYCTKSESVLFLFVLLVLINPIIPFHIVLVVPETLTGFLVTGLLYIRIFYRESWKKSILLGLLYGFTFQVRPVILFLPFLLFLYDWIVERGQFRVMKNITILFIYVVSMLPYGYWNYNTNGIFSVTSLEGGGGVMHLGYWSLKMPGYTEKRYWNNSTPEGLINFTPESEISGNIQQFEKEWDYIDSSCAPYLTEQDRKTIPYMRQFGNRFVTYNGRYTYEREKLLKKFAIQHYREDWKYTVKIKLYTAVRLWVTGIHKDVLKSRQPMLIMQELVAPVTTGLTFLLAIIFIPLAWFKRRSVIMPLFPLLITVIYWDLIHLPFAIQSRYTVPVRLLLIALIAVSIDALLNKKKLEN